MTHGIEEREWLEYVDGVLKRSRAAEIERHVEDCADCAQLLAELSEWQRKLSREGLLLRNAAAPSDEEINHFVGRALETVTGGTEAGNRRGWSIVQGLFLLRALIEPIFGRGTAQVAIDLAVRRCTVSPGMELGRGEWPLFVNNLSETLGSISGGAASRLVMRVGSALAEAV
jgi:anti-sigma factor RsiW